MKVVVLGAGLGGLSASYELAKKGVDVTVLEKEGRVGGMAKSHSEGGFTYDLGPHRFHTKEDSLVEHVNRLLDGDLDEKERVSRILLEGRFFDYPLKVGNAFFNMPPSTTARIMLDYTTMKLRNILGGGEDGNFEEWVLSRFGRKLYEIYFKVYTEKTWGIPCTELSADWAAQRISLLSLWDTLVKTLSIGETPRTYVSRFHYPRSHGIGRISEAYERGIRDRGGKIRVSSPVKEVTASGGRITGIGYDGGTIKVGDDDIVFNTIPITDFIRCVSPKPPDDVLEANERLRFRSIVFVYLKFDRDRVSHDHWIYLPELKYKANRVSESKNFNAGNTPDGKTIVGAEITCQMGDETWNASKEELSERVLKDMVGIGLVEEGEYIDSTVRKMEHAYPVYDLTYRENLDTAIDYLKGFANLRFFGRNGLFRYNNMDHSIHMGLKAAEAATDKNVDYMKVATEERWFG
ncbi:MAG: FAD-dependent oxidoreductase [Candidatus Altiarchaeales archaeon]|nr:FAD-dependent oxidoreductase [Candidatus Altiarchaeales archaeon]MBD3417089.1 FAD-dependent oxidoreductase [Candidatus Altiarchaeales archaeon]